MRLVVGLGNPGLKYQGTRHNVGFSVMNVLCARWGLSAARAQHGALVSTGSFQGQDVSLSLPQQYMNRSGRPVFDLMTERAVPINDLIVVHDDMGLPFGAIRCKMGGGHGGHNGLRDLFEHIGRDFLRVRVGIGRPEGNEGTVDFVLGKWSEAEKATLPEILQASCEAIEIMISKGATAAMNLFNVRPNRVRTPFSPNSSQQGPDEVVQEQ